MKYQAGGIGHSSWKDNIAGDMENLAESDTFPLGVGFLRKVSSILPFLFEVTLTSEIVWSNTYINFISISMPKFRLIFSYRKASNV